MTDPKETTLAETPSLNSAADALVCSLENVADLPGLRAGLNGSIAFWHAAAGLSVVSSPQRKDAEDLIETWRALDALAAAVQIRKAGH